MGTVSYDEQGAEYKKLASIESKGQIVKFLIRAGFAKDKRQAEYILLVCSFVFIAIAVFLMWPQKKALPVDPNNGTNNETAIIQYQR